MKWILKVDCELEKEEKKSGIKLQKKFGRQQEFKYFFKFSHKYKELFGGAN